MSRGGPPAEVGLNREVCKIEEMENTPGEPPENGIKDGKLPELLMRNAGLKYGY